MEKTGHAPLVPVFFINYRW